MMPIVGIRSQRYPNRRKQLLLSLFVILATFLSPCIAGISHAAQANLAWDANTESNIKGYKIYYGTVSGDYDWFIDVGNVTTWTVANLTEGVTYYFAATAYDNSQPALESALSNEASKSTCSYAISPTSATFTASGGAGNVYVTTQAGCPWTARAGDSWMTITSGSSGAGSGNVSYSVAANTTVASRTASSSIAGQVYTVHQAEGTTYTITATAATGGTISPRGSIQVANGTSQTFIITPNSGYKIKSVKVDGVSVGTIPSYTLQNVTANHSISVSFTRGRK